jgi:hypothetical protein
MQVQRTPTIGWEIELSIATGPASLDVQYLLYSHFCILPFAAGECCILNFF